MKLINCPECNDVIALNEHHVRSCYCGKTAGKYCDDEITAVITENAYVVGIDNNGFRLAKWFSDQYKENENRVDGFFTGWVPNHPGEVILVKTVNDVLTYDYHLKPEDRNYTSTWPSEVAEENEKTGLFTPWWKLFNAILCKMSRKV